MHQYLFDVKKQLGLARSCKITIGDHSFQSPAFILPVIKHQSTQNKFSTTSLNLIERMPNSFKEGKIPIILSQIIDQLKLLHIKDNIIQENASNDYPKNELDKREFIEKQPQFPILFRQDKSQWGIPFYGTQPLKSQLETCQEISILCDNIPNQKMKRLENYNHDLLALRLKLYEELVFTSLDSGKFILEISFTKNQSDLEIIESFIQKHKKKLIGVKIKNLFRNLMGFKDILAWVMDLKSKLASDLLFILGGRYKICDLAFAIYLGFDLFDLSGILSDSRNGLYAHAQGLNWLREIRYPLCGCGACLHLKQYLPAKFNPSQEIIELVSQHNLNYAIGEIYRIKNNIWNGELRNYLERQIHSSPLLASALRWTDKQHPKVINARYPIVGNHKVMCIGTESYQRPEILNYFARLISNVSPAKHYSTIVILPCSARKPYSTSQSHGRFSKILRYYSKKFNNTLHEIIVTSPIGVVPRELENIFPVAHYDIPVTGEWDQDEIHATGTQLALWLKKYPNLENKKFHILAHVGGGYRKACQFAEETLKSENIDININFTIPQTNNCSPSSREGLEFLKASLQNIEKVFESDISELKDKKRAIYEPTPDEIKIRATIDYQFGSNIGEFIIQHGAILAKSRHPQYKEIYTYDGTGKILFGRIMTDTGLIKLSSSGAYMLFDSTIPKIYLNDEKMRGTTVFAPLVSTIDPDIHPNDDVIIVNNKHEFVGIGAASLASVDMIKINYGSICSIRKKVDPKPSKNVILEKLLDDE